MAGRRQIEISEADIRLRSYLIWEREGRQDGRSDEYWFRAKAELEADRGAGTVFLETGSPLQGTHSERHVAPRCSVSVQPIRGESSRPVAR